jgi:hypothetical protein
MLEQHIFARSGEWLSDVNCSEGMDHATHYRDQAKHARLLADAAWQLNLAHMLRCIAKDYDRAAEEIETTADEIRHADPTAPNDPHHAFPK